MTKRLWIVHSWLGLLAGLGLLVIGVTGSMLVFREQIDALLAPSIMRADPAGQARMGWDALYAAAKKAWPEYEVTGFGPRGDPALADIVYLIGRENGADRMGMLNPYTGTSLREPLTSQDTFTGWLLELHYTWFAGHVGILITGIVGVMFCLLGLTGVWLYRGFWKSFFTLRWGKSARIFFSDAHKMIGISSVAFNLILGFTGAYWNLTHVAADGLAHHEHETKDGLMAAGISLENLTRLAAEKIPDFEARWISFPTAEGEDLTLWGRTSKQAFRSDYGSSAVFDPQTGALKDFVDLRKAGAWANFTDSFSPLHYGTFGGLPVKILWCILGLAPGMLAVSGFLIWRSRRKTSPKPTKHE